MNWGALRDELNNDPLSRGYAGMTDSEAADDLNTAYRDVTRSVLSGATIFNSIVPSEFEALADAQQRFVRDVFSLGDSVDIGPGTNARTVLLDAFGVGTTTRDNLVAAVSVTISRSDDLGLGSVRGTDVKLARAL